MEKKLAGEISLSVYDISVSSRAGWPRILEATQGSLRLAAPSHRDHVVHMVLIFGVFFGSVPFLFLLLWSLIPSGGPSPVLLFVVLLGFVAVLLLLGKFLIWWSLRLEFAGTVRWPERVLTVRVRSVDRDALRIPILHIVAREKEGSLFVNARPRRLREALELAGQTVIEPNPLQNGQA